MGLWIAFQQGPRCLQYPLGGVEVARFAQQGPSRPRARAATPLPEGDRVVLEGLRTVQQRFVIVGGEVEATRFGVLEVLEQDLGQVDGEGQVGAAPAGFEQVEQSGQQEGVVVEIRRKAGASILVHGEQPARCPSLATAWRE